MVTQNVEDPDSNINSEFKKIYGQIISRGFPHLYHELTDVTNNA